MIKRFAAALLWFYAGWYAGSMLASFTGMTPVLGVVLGVAIGMLVAIDPRQSFWTRRPAVADGTSAA